MTHKGVPMRYQAGGITKEFELIPSPRKVTLAGAATMLPNGGRITEERHDGDPTCLLAAQLAADIEAATGIAWDWATGTAAYGVEADGVPRTVTTGERAWPGFITLCLDTAIGDETAYRLHIGADGVRVAGGGAEGLRSGAQTLRQIVRQCAPALPTLDIEDRPAYGVRGYYLDVTRGRVPTLEWLKQWADLLCRYKYNQLHLYVEHTFAFDGMSEVWRGVDALKPADIVVFDEYCAARGIELVPSVSTFGHQYMAMRTQTFRGLGEFPEDAERSYSLVERMSHHTLNITDPRAFEFSCKLVDDYLQLFRSKRFNICADETFDLGRGRSHAEAERRGVADMYAGYVSNLCAHLAEQGRETMFWGDIAIKMPEILSKLPKNVVLLNWLYDADITEDKVRLVAESGAKQYVCPAVQGWNGTLPRMDDAWANISRLAAFGLKYGAAGFLVTDWGDYGHINDPRMSVPGMAYGAQCAWDPAWAREWDDGAACGGSADGSGNGARDVSTRGGLDARAEMNRRLSLVEYGDSAGDYAEAMAEASRCRTFGWEDMVQYVEVDDGTGPTEGNAGDGRVNHEVAHIFARFSELPEGDGFGDELDDPRQVRVAMLHGIADRLAETPQVNARLDAAIERLGAAVARSTADRRYIGQTVMVAAEGQRLFNELGWWLAVEVGAIETSATSAKSTDTAPTMLTNSAHPGTAEGAYRTAAKLEEWFERYVAVWRTVSRESELKRVAHIVFTCADELRRLAPRG